MIIDELKFEFNRQRFKNILHDYDFTGAGLASLQDIYFQIKNILKRDGDINMNNIDYENEINKNAALTAGMKASAYLSGYKSIERKINIYGMQRMLTEIKELGKESL